MVSIKIKFRPSAVIGNEGTIYYQIIHERKIRQLVSSYHLLPWEWNDSRSVIMPPKAGCRESPLKRIRELIRADVAVLRSISRRLEADGTPYSADDVVDEFSRFSEKYSLVNFMESIIRRLKDNGKIRTSETYRSALNSFRTFLASDAGNAVCLGNRDIRLDGLTSEIMEAFEGWHRSRGLTPNTISFYTRILRAVYNRAVDDGAIGDNNPFRHVYTGVDKTVKRALPLSVIRKIKILDLSTTPALDFARDMFMMSFCLRGMSFVDMAFLKKTDLRNGHIIYRRRKTGQLLSIEWTREMQAILDKYHDTRSEYLMPVLRDSGANLHYAYRNASYNINRNLKKIASMLGIGIPLTLYVARHSWASAAKAKGIPLSVISEGMGHDSETTTQIYLASLDTSVVDRANNLILKSLR